MALTFIFLSPMSPPWFSNFLSLHFPTFLSNLPFSTSLCMCVTAGACCQFP